MKLFQNIKIANKITSSKELDLVTYAIILGFLLFYIGWEFGRFFAA